MSIEDDDYMDQLLEEARSVQMLILRSDAEPERKALARAFLKETESLLRECNVDGCDRQRVARGMCFLHWNRVVRMGKPAESHSDSPGVSNPYARERMNEEEFVRFKDLRAQGFSARDIAFELKKNVKVLSIAWDYESFSQYQRGGRDRWSELEDEEETV